MTTKRPIIELPAPSTALTEGVTFLRRGRRVSLTMSFSWEDVESSWILQFQNVRADSHLTEAACTAWHIRDVYDTVCEIEDSEWGNSVSEVVQDHSHEEAQLKHYMVFFDGEGVFEFIAGDCSLERLETSNRLTGF